MWPADLSVRLRILALVGLCPANWLMRRRPIPRRGLSAPFLPGIPIRGEGYQRVTHPFAAGPLRAPLDLHVLGTPPAFILSQDRTL